MKRNRKNINSVFLIPLFFLLVFSFSSCIKKKESNPSAFPENTTDTKAILSAEKEDKSNIIIGFSQIGAESAWRTCNTASMQKAASDSGIQMVYANAEQKQENQIKAIRSFIVYQVDVIVFVPIVQDGWDNVLAEAKDANIPVIALDRKLHTTDEKLYAGYLGTDSLEEGRNAARFLEKKYAGLSNHYNIVEIRGTDGSSVTEGRHDGFCEIISKDERFSIIYSESGDFLRSRGNEIARGLVADGLVKSDNQFNSLQIDGKKVDIIYSHNDGMTLGALDVFEKNNINTGKDITIISIDAEQEAINALKAGKINCVIECNPKLGPECMSLVKTLFDEGSIPRLVHVKEQVFTEYDNLDSIEPRGY